MVEVISIYNRPDQSVTWHTPLVLSPEVEAKYKITRTIEVILNNEFQLILRTTYDTQETYDAFSAETEVIDQMKAIAEYHAANHITADPKIITNI